MHLWDADWERRAACRGADAALFFGPVTPESKRDRERREADAKRICVACPVLVPCRDHALRAGERYGVWGGLGEAERQAMLAERATEKVS